ncbi:hypothetical protein MNBD_CHLOROFLEXI01-5221 [hydrothermal vent metagenome]|uniref:Uncharacterized protein n=1 Tax=hydrothermal vent metagenome TaxID=652676 RepID=A0A3B0URQ4_9ZZZZ
MGLIIPSTNPVIVGQTITYGRLLGEATGEEVICWVGF